MKAVPALSLLFLLVSISVFGHGVERGSIWNGIDSSDLGLLSEITKQEITQAVENRCDLTGLVSATAELAEPEEPISVMGTNGFRIRIRAKMESSETPAIIMVLVSEKSFSTTGEYGVMEYNIESPLCR